MNHRCRRGLAVLLALVMMLSLWSVPAFATETEPADGTGAGHDHVHDQIVSDPAAPEEEIVPEPEVVPEPDASPDAPAPGLLEEVQAGMDAILEKYSIEIGMTEEEIGWVIQTTNYPSNPMIDIKALEEQILQLTEEEFAVLEAYESTATFAAFWNVLDLMMTPMMATTVEVLDGNVSVTDSVGNGAVSGGTVTIKAAGSWFSKETNNITITNNRY